MGLKDRLLKQGSTLTAFNGATPSTIPGASDQSVLHNEYSINGNLHVNAKPEPSTLDLDGLTPPRYTENLPG